MLHLSDFSGILFDGKLVQGKRGGLVFDFEISLVHPHRDIFPGQTPLSVKLPVLEFYKAMAVDLAGELCGVQCAREHLFGEGPANTPRSTSEGLCRPS